MENNVERLINQAKEKEMWKTEKPSVSDYLVHDCGADGISKGTKKAGIIKKITGNTAFIVEIDAKVEKGVALNSPFIIGFISSKMFAEPRKKTKE